MENEQFGIRYTPLAYEDLNEIDSYISETLGNPQAAMRLMEEIEKSVDQLERFPMIGSAVEDPFLESKGYRKLVVQNYLIFYLVDASRQLVVIMRVQYGAREYRNLL